MTDNRVYLVGQILPALIQQPTSNSTSLEELVEIAVRAADLTLERLLPKLAEVKLVEVTAHTDIRHQYLNPKTGEISEGDLVKLELENR